MLSLGIDIGAVSATAALLSDRDDLPPQIGVLESLRELPSGQRLWVNAYTRTQGRPVATARGILTSVRDALGEAGLTLDAIVFTGSAGKTCAAACGGDVLNAFRATAGGLAVLDIDAASVFEIGGESSNYLHVERNSDGSYGIVDYSTNGDCAAGTGSFIDQQANRLQYRVEEIGEICASADRGAQIAGRCSVFAKSDMIHAQQKGYTPAEVLRGLCEAVARNFKSAVVRSHAIAEPVVFLGGLTANRAVVAAMEETFDLAGRLAIPEPHAHIPAIGAAGQGFAANESTSSDAPGEFTRAAFPAAEPLTMDGVTLLRDQAVMRELPESATRDNPLDAVLGIDIGSVSTNLVLLDTDGAMIDEVYTRTQGRPIQVVTESLADLAKKYESRLRICGVGTTGSGRELIGELIGADTVNDEITCHKTGAAYIGETLLGGRMPDTIFEIGGQDSKYIALDEGVVVDFTMNEACAAGTGSFLEERAEELGVAIKDEFATRALTSAAPLRLGERCTVFMERDVNSYLHRGATKNDLLAGLCLSVVQNYINRVVRGRRIGETIFFQGGTAYNDATAAAFARVTGKEIIVPPHNGVMGAVGAALLARDKQATGATTKFRGWDLTAVKYDLKEFTCNACSNACTIQQFDVEGQRTYWGDKCSDKFRSHARATKQPLIDDLFSAREELLTNLELPAVSPDAPTVGIPRAMWTWQQQPFWRALLAGLGARSVLSDETNKSIITAGQSAIVSEPCFPILVAHGHVDALLESDCDAVLLPNILSMETPWEHTESHLCPWHQTLPFVARRSPQLAAGRERFLSPTVEFRRGEAFVARQLADEMLGHPLAKRLGWTKKQILRATADAYRAQQQFEATYRALGQASLDALDDAGAPGIILLGRPYNIHDAGVNLSVARKLREHYGCNVLPIDALALDDVDIRDINPNMFWDLGRKIVAAAKFVGARENLHIIYVTNFKCGPDSFVKHYITTASQKPFLSLQFDGHSNDAGMMTRCEAYLDSKGLLRE
ncbi:MAG: hypothetical protein HN370_02540 [Phycisphaerales bacterium]|nr:hypothetical protein [Phycisphaerales bacterium]